MAAGGLPLAQCPHRKYTLRYDLPAGTSLQNSRRLSEILFLTRKELEETGQYVA
ncbi:hypothetical protein R3134_004518 [Salmonella enterica]|nr:hypothetical protein [Salmonella enterica]